jgi:hypothetical protein
MKKALVSFGTGPHAEYLDIARPSFKAYAARHSYDYYEPSKIDPVRPAPWYKVKALQSLLKAGYDAAIFIGADLVIVDGRDDVMADVIPGKWQALTAHLTGDGYVPNTDMWIVTPPMLSWLDECWKLTQFTYHGWWEQAALLHLMGYNLAPCKQVQESDLADHTQFLDASWNVHIWDMNKTSHPRFQHATMWPDRPAIMRDWAKQAEGWINE